MQASPPKATWPKAVRLASRKTINRVFAKGQYHPLGVLQAKTLPRQPDELPEEAAQPLASTVMAPPAQAPTTATGESRFLISVRKAYGSAPQRNRLKRLVREVARQHRHQLLAAYDICLFVTRKPKQEPDYQRIELELGRLFSQLNAYPANHPTPTKP